MNTAPHLPVLRAVGAIYNRLESGDISGKLARRELGTLRRRAGRMNLEGEQKALVGRVLAACGRKAAAAIKAKKAADTECMRAIYADSVSGSVLESFRTGRFVTVYAN